MRVHISLLGGSLLDIEMESGRSSSDGASFGFTGGSRCESIDTTPDRNPVDLHVTSAGDGAR